MCVSKIKNNKVHRVDRRTDVKQLTRAESIQVGVHVICFATPIVLPDGIVNVRVITSEHWGI